MADNVQWIRLKVGMFDGNSFKKIKRATIGGVNYRDKLTAIWFELLDLAGKGNADGCLVDNNEIPFETYEDIAIMLDRETEEIELCMQFYLKEKMIELIGKVYCLTNFMQYQNKDGLEKIREQKRLAQAKWRERKAQGLIGTSNKCVYCGEEANTIDHIIPRVKGGTDLPENLVGCCSRCNSAKSSMDLIDFLNNPVNDFICLESVLSCKKLKVKYDTKKCRYYVDTTSILLSNSLSTSNSIREDNINKTPFEIFIEKYSITCDNYSGVISEIDFDLLDKAFSESKWLQANMTCLSNICKQYNKIVGGAFRDFVKPKETTKQLSDIDFLINKGFSKEWVMELTEEERREKRKKWES